MHIGLITYQVGHLRTWQLLRHFMTAAQQVTVFAFPFKHRPEVNYRYRDRPEQILLGLDLERYCRENNIAYRKINSWDLENASQLDYPDEETRPRAYLTCIGKIIPPAFIAGRKILNVHPGLLPHNRGVDSFKRSLVNEWPFGVTLHVIDEQIDRR